MKGGIQLGMQKSLDLFIAEKYFRKNSVHRSLSNDGSRVPLFANIFFT